MTPAPVATQPHAVPPYQSNNLVRRVTLDVSAVLLIAAICLAAGLSRNWLSAQPLPFVYQSPEQRFDAELTSLVAAPSFALAPAATVGLAQFRSAVETKSALIIDARPSSFFVQGHVPGALNLARDNFAHDYHQLSGTLKSRGDKPIFVYCSGGACHDSRLVASALLTLGFDNVSVFTGGWEDWSAKRLPVSTETAR